MIDLKHIRLHDENQITLVKYKHPAYLQELLRYSEIDGETFDNFTIEQSNLLKETPWNNTLHLVSQFKREYPDYQPTYPGVVFSIIISKLDSNQLKNVIENAKDDYLEWCNDHQEITNLSDIDRFYNEDAIKVSSCEGLCADDLAMLESFK